MLMQRRYMIADKQTLLLPLLARNVVPAVEVAVASVQEARGMFGLLVRTSRTMLLKSTTGRKALCQRANGMRSSIACAGLCP